MPGKTVLSTLTHLGLLTCLGLGFLHVSLGPDPATRTPLDVPAKLIHLSCTQKLSSVVPEIVVTWDFGKMVQALAIHPKDSSMYQLWMRCALYLNKDITFMVKEQISGTLVFQLTHNFAITLPSENLEKWNYQNLEKSLRMKPRLKPETKYIFYIQCKNGLAMEFQTDVAQSVPVDDVLVELGLQDCIPTFRQARIDRDSFVLLTEQHLTEMGLPIGYKVKIVAKINEVRRGLCISIYNNLHCQAKDSWKLNLRRLSNTREFLVSPNFT